MKRNNEELVAEIQAGYDIDANFEQLIEQNRGFIFSQISKYIGSGHCEADEAFQLAYIAFWKLINKYDAEKGSVLFLAEYYIKSEFAAYAETSQNIRIPRNHRLKLNRLICAKNEFLMEYGREPSEKELARMLNITIDDLRQLEETLFIYNTSSLDAPILDENGAEQSVQDLIADGVDHFQDVETKLNDEQTWELIKSILKKEDYDLFYAIVHEGETLQSMADKLGVTYQRIEQKIKYIGQRLSHNQQIKNVFDGQIKVLEKKKNNEAHMTKTSYKEWYNNNYTSSVENYVIHQEEIEKNEKKLMEQQEHIRYINEIYAKIHAERMQERLNKANYINVP